MNETNSQQKTDAETEAKCPELKHFTELADFVERNRSGKMELGTYVMSVRAAFSKCYDFNVLMREALDDPRVAFCLPSLRGICEDVIVLGYLRKMTPVDRNDLISKLMTHGTGNQTRIQSQFFSTTRPQQPVLGPSLTPDETKDLEAKIRAIWHSNGWPNLSRGVIPPTREIAQKQGSEVLLCLYDYIYRLTSGTVHFDVPSLWKTGWGDPPEFEFSVRHFKLYYSGFVRTYGAFLFVSYIELLADILDPSEAELLLVDEIRKWLRCVSRWPEMVTFEEMNLAPPQFNQLLSVMAGLMQHDENPTLLE